MTQTLTQVSFWDPVAFSTAYNAQEISTVQWLTEKVDGFFHCSGDLWIPTGKAEDKVNGSLGLHPVSDDAGCSYVSTILKIIAFMTLVVPFLLLIAKLALRLTQNFHVALPKREDPPASPRQEQKEQIRASSSPGPAEVPAVAEAAPEREGPGSPPKPSSEATSEGMLFESKSSGTGAAPAAQMQVDATGQALINRWAERYGFDPKRKFQNAIGQLKKDPDSFLNKPEGPFDQFKAQCINAGVQDGSIDLFTAFGWMYNLIQKITPVLKEKNFPNFCYTPRNLGKEEGFAHHFMSAPTRSSFPHEVLSEEDQAILWTMKNAYISGSDLSGKAEIVSGSGCSLELFVLRVLKAENLVANFTIEEFSFYTYIFPTRDY